MTDVPENTLTMEPVGPAVPPSGRRRAKRAMPSDPRRSPETIADPSPDVAAGEPPSRAGNAVSIAGGVAVLRAALRNVPNSPGVYRMLDRKGDAVYVGKARNLKSRVQNYTHPAGLSNRLRRMVAETAILEIVVTGTEAEALLLECNLIKRLMPRYNVLLRDDKSFPFIHLTDSHQFPQLTKYRGARDKGGAYFGPFASAGAVNRTLITLQKAFLLRSCSDNVFANRTRPCLLFPIRRRVFLPGAAATCSSAWRPRWSAPPRCSISRRRRWSATASAPCHWCRATRTSMCPALSTPTSSRPIRRAARPAFRCSFSVAARTGATAPIS